MARRRLSFDDPSSEESARTAGCRYVDDRRPGLARIEFGSKFRYVDAARKPVRDRATLERIRRLAIPPAWVDVWICPSPNGHIQATGRDARGRKQYRYHAKFRAVREETKFEHMVAFARALPTIREAIDHDLQRPQLRRDKILATLVRLLEISLIRIGNEEYARDNGSFGLTTMRTRHVDIVGSTIRFHFRGKSGVEHEVAVQDRRVARVLQRCCDLPGQELFQYVDAEGQRRAVDSSDVNEYLQRVTGERFTAKDFRTWAATVLAAQALGRIEQVANVRARSDAAMKREIASAIVDVSRRLGNTPGVCRKCYVHPRIIETHGTGKLAECMKRRARAAAGLSAEEVAVLALLEDQSEAVAA